MTKQRFLIRRWLHANCALVTCFLTLQKVTALPKSVVFKYRWSLIYRLYCTLIPSCRTKSTWAIRNGNYKHTTYMLPYKNNYLQRFTTCHDNIFNCISRTHGSPATKILFNIHHDSLKNLKQHILNIKHQRL